MLMFAFRQCTQEIDIQDENINEGTSKMEEITNILSMTQMRLNKFKVCFQFSLIKIGLIINPLYQFFMIDLL